MWSIYTAIYHFTYRVYKRLKEIRHSLNLVEALAKLLTIKGFHNLWRCHLKNEKAWISPGSAYYTTFNHKKTILTVFLCFFVLLLYMAVLRSRTFFCQSRSYWRTSVEPRESELTEQYVDWLRNTTIYYLVISVSMYSKLMLKIPLFFVILSCTRTRYFSTRFMSWRRFPMALWLWTNDVDPHWLKLRIRILDPHPYGSRCSSGYRG